MILRLRGLAAAVAMAVMVASAAGCGSGDSPGNAGAPAVPVIPGSPPVSNVVGVFSSALLLSNAGTAAPGTFLAGAIPSDGVFTAPVLTTSNPNPQVVTGGALLLTVSTVQPVSDILVGVPGQPGFFDLPVAGVAGSDNGPQQYTVALPLSSRAPSSGFIVNVSTRGLDGSFSMIAPQPITVNTRAQTSSTLQVVLTWNTPVDMDLHVKTPSGIEIGYDQTTDLNGGSLNLDSNSNCRIDNVDNENVSWSGAPLRGQYVVRPDLFANCGRTGPFSYVVTIIKGGVSQSFLGQFAAGEADANAAGAGSFSQSHTIAFTY